MCGWFRFLIKTTVKSEKKILRTIEWQWAVFWDSDFGFLVPYNRFIQGWRTASNSSVLYRWAINMFFRGYKIRSSHLLRWISICSNFSMKDVKLYLANYYPNKVMSKNEFLRFISWTNFIQLLITFPVCRACFTLGNWLSFKENEWPNECPFEHFSSACISDWFCLRYSMERIILCGQFHFKRAMLSDFS